MYITITPVLFDHSHQYCFIAHTCIVSSLTPVLASVWFATENLQIHFKQHLCQTPGSQGRIFLSHRYSDDTIIAILKLKLNRRNTEVPISGNITFLFYLTTFYDETYKKQVV